MSTRRGSGVRGRSGPRTPQRSDGSSERTSTTPQLSGFRDPRHTTILRQAMLEQSAGPSAPRASAPRASTPPASTPPASTPRASVPRASTPPASAPRASAPRASTPQAPFAYPRPTGQLFHRPTVPAEPHLPEVRMPQMQRPATPVSATSSGGGPTVSDPPPALYFPAFLPAIPDTTPEGVPIPEQPPRVLTPAEAYVYVSFVDMTLRRARVSLKTKEVSSTATSAAGTKNNV